MSLENSFGKDYLGVSYRTTSPRSAPVIIRVVTTCRRCGCRSTAFAWPAGSPPETSIAPIWKVRQRLSPPARLMKQCDTALISSRRSRSLAATIESGNLADTSKLPGLRMLKDPTGEAPAKIVSGIGNLSDDAPGTTPRRRKVFPCGGTQSSTDALWPTQRSGYIPLNCATPN